MENETTVAALIRVMHDVQAVGKHEQNRHQGFQFRGIDAVMNAVGPAFRKHGVTAFPRVIDSHYEQIEVGAKRSLTGHVRLIVEYTFAAEHGQPVQCVVAAEAMDAGDKATAKAMSVAFRTALLQVLCLPTDEPDPDSQSYERSTDMPGKAWEAQIAEASTADELRKLWASTANLPDAEKLHDAIMARKAELG